MLFPESGQNKLPKHVVPLNNKYTNIMQLVDSEIWVY
jgi:hypothetical protein